MSYLPANKSNLHIECTVSGGAVHPCSRYILPAGSRVLSTKSMLLINLYFPTSAVITDASYLLGAEVDMPSLKAFEKRY